MIIQYRVTKANGQTFTYSSMMPDVVGTFEYNHEGLSGLGLQVEILSEIPARHLSCTIAAAEFRTHPTR